ncbi:MAG: transcription antitermination factor NusB [Candidatus Fimivicinus sp.]|nr:transcription antitermination factor NusB [Oscillospiraceae bacterium]MDY5591113.1 transcription antitermination factor NusB [Candidatus Fimivicinus sp.]
MTRRQAREQAFTLIFEKSFHPEITVEEIISAAVEARYLQTDEFAVLLAKTVDEKQPEIDSMIEQNAIGWRKDRISRVSLSLMRLALCEMLYIEDVPTSVSINEAVELAKIYASQEDASFINGVLGTVSRQLGG